MRSARPVATAARALQTRTYIQVPHPTLSSPHPTRFAIRTIDPIASMAHALAIVRAFENRFGPVLTVDVPRDADTLRGGRIIKIETLRPVEVSSEVFEIPASKVSGDRFGGVALGDLVGALSGAGEGSAGEGIRFRVEVAKNDRGVRVGRIHPRSASEVEEDDRIVRALGRFGGFFGGMGEVADKFARLVVEKEKEKKKEPELVVLSKPKLVEMEVIEPISAVIEEAEVEVEAGAEVTPEVKAEPAVKPKTRKEKLAEKALEAALVNARMEEEAAKAAKEAESLSAEEKRKQELDWKRAQSGVRVEEPELVDAVETPLPEEKKSSWGFFGKK